VDSACRSTSKEFGSNAIGCGDIRIRANMRWRPIVGQPEVIQQHKPPSTVNLQIAPSSARNRWHHRGGQGQFSMTEDGRSSIRLAFLLESVYKGGRRFAVVLAHHPFESSFEV
jgi:hypothetical protein